MGQPALVMNDRIRGECAIHQVPNPASGAPQPSPAPLPFSAPLMQGLISTVMIGGKPAAVVGSAGYNRPPHVGLHATDLFFTPTLQSGRVTKGSATVRIGGQAAATSASVVVMCGNVPGRPVPSQSTVLIGG